MLLQTGAVPLDILEARVTSGSRKTSQRVEYAETPDLIRLLVLLWWRTAEADDGGTIPLILRYVTRLP